MFTIGDFARHGRVSVRMLRHYDAAGLLRPARVDPLTGYRYYEAGQLARLNRIIALKDLGFTLEQVRVMLDEQVSAEQLRGMLRLRRAELADRIAGDTARLGQVGARLSIIEKEGVMPADEIVLKAATRGSSTWNARTTRSNGSPSCRSPSHQADRLDHLHDHEDGPGQVGWRNRR